MLSRAGGQGASFGLLGPSVESPSCSDGMISFPRNGIKASDATSARSASFAAAFQKNEHQSPQQPRLS